MLRLIWKPFGCLFRTIFGCLGAVIIAAIIIVIAYFFISRYLAI